MAGSRRSCASAACKTLLIERGRHVDHKTDYQDFAAPWEVPQSRPGARGRSAPRLRHPEHLLRVQLRHQAMVGASDSEHPYLTPEGPAVPLDARLSPRWPLAHLGAPDLSLQRHRFQRQQAKTATASTGRFATRTFRRGTTASNASPASPAATKDSSSCPTAVSCRRWNSTASSSTFKQQAREQPSVAPRDDRPLRASDRAHRRAHRARARALPAAQRV